jgi:hypothetical protein
MPRSLVVAALVLAACQATDLSTSPPADPALAGHHAALSKKKSPQSLPVVELARARSATARYHNVQKAYDDGYVDINVVLPNMGRHLMKPGLVNATFNVSEPELLVYSEGPGNKLKLVAVEYAVPLDQSVNAPAGFTGDGDEWTPNTTFGLWLLHAWVWKDNPDGVFNPTNSQVP